MTLYIRDLQQGGGAKLCKKYIFFKGSYFKNLNKSEHIHEYECKILIAKIKWHICENKCATSHTDVCLTLKHDT